MKLPIKVKPYNHQKIAFNFAIEKLEQEGCAALLMDMGLGKSLASIAIAGHPSCSSFSIAKLNAIS